MATQKVIHVGNSLAVTLPSQFAKGNGIKAGDDVSVFQASDNSISFTFNNPRQLSLSQLALQPKTKKI